jgi:hypothetical protein
LLISNMHFCYFHHYLTYYSSVHFSRGAEQTYAFIILTLLLVTLTHKYLDYYILHFSILKGYDPHSCIN